MTTTMSFDSAMELITGTNGYVHVRRKKWRSPKQFVRHFNRYTRTTPFRGGLSCASYYATDEDEHALDWYVSHSNLPT